MSTRANIVLKDGDDELWFYRHSDGYPEGTKPLLDKFMKWIKSGVIRNNLSQASGWLIILGALEYQSIPECKEIDKTKYGSYGDIKSIEPPKDWKVGAIEPTTGRHGDIEFLYTIDLVKKTIKTKSI